jgi:hypothetical protein
LTANIRAQWVLPVSTHVILSLLFLSKHIPVQRIFPRFCSNDHCPVYIHIYVLIKRYSDEEKNFQAYHKLTSMKANQIVIKYVSEKRTKIVVCWMSHRRYVSFSFQCTCAYNCINSYRFFSFFSSFFLSRTHSFSRCDISPFSSMSHSFSFSLLYEKKSPQATSKEKMPDWPKRLESE